MTEEKKKKKSSGRKKNTDKVSTTDLQAQLDELKSALHLANARAEAAEALQLAQSAADSVFSVVDSNQEMIEVVNFSRNQIFADVTDRYGRPRTLQWDSQGSKNAVTALQYEELLNNSSSLFDRGMLGMEGESVNPNVTGTFMEFLDGLDISEIASRVEAITEPSVLSRIFNEIEDYRTITVDEHGNPLRDANGSPIAKFREMSIPEKLLMDSVINRVFEMTGVRLQTTEG